MNGDKMQSAGRLLQVCAALAFPVVTPSHTLVDHVARVVLPVPSASPIPERVCS